MKIKGIACGRGLGGVCDHINYLGYHIKEKLVLKAWGTAMLKGPGVYVFIRLVCVCVCFWGGGGVLCRYQ